MPVSIKELAEKSIA